MRWRPWAAPLGLLPAPRGPGRTHGHACAAGAPALAASPCSAAVAPPAAHASPLPACPAARWRPSGGTPAGQVHHEPGSGPTMRVASGGGSLGGPLEFQPQGSQAPSLTGLVLGVQVSLRCRICMRGVSVGALRASGAGGWAQDGGLSRPAASTRDQAEASVARRRRSNASMSSSSAEDTRVSVCVGGRHILPPGQALDVSWHLVLAQTLQASQFPKTWGLRTRVRWLGATRWAQGQDTNSPRLSSEEVGGHLSWLLWARPAGMAQT